MTAVIPGRRNNQFNLLSQARRQPGSTFKTFVLAAAIEKGIDPDTSYYVSAPFTYKPVENGNCDDGSWWCVRTYDSSYNGWTSIARATLRSDNTVYAQLTLDVGPDKVGEMAQKLGVRSPLKVGGHYVPAMGLGSIAVSPLDMASAYATLAAGGIYSEPTAIRKVVLPNGKEDTKAGWGSPKRTRVIPDGVAWKVTQILEDNVSYGTGVRAAFGRPAAGKTGTTDKHADAWFVGYTPDLATAVWMGYQAGEIPMDERPRDRRLGRQLPGRDLAPDDGAHDRAAPGARLRRPEGLPGRTSRSSAARSRSPTTRTTSRRRTTTATDSTSTDTTPAPTTPPAKPDEAGQDPEAAPSREARARGGRGRARARRRGLRPRLAPRLAARPPPRRQRLRHRPALPRAPDRGLRAYLAGLCVLRRTPPALRAVIVLAAAIQLVPLAAPLLLSTDAWTYWSYGWIGARSDGNPYADPPADFPDNPALDYMGSDWLGTTTVYGPAFTLASEPLAVVAGDSDAVAAWSYKALAAAAALAAALLAGRLARRRAFAIALVGWNPVLAVHLAGGGHNDAWVGALILAALALSASRRAAGRRRPLDARDRGQVGAGPLPRAALARVAGEPAGRTASAGSSARRPGSRSAPPCSTAAPGRSRSSRSPGTRRSRRATRSRTGSSSSGCRTTSRSRSRSRRSWSGSPSLARDALVGARGSRSPPASCS